MRRSPWLAAAALAVWGGVRLSAQEESPAIGLYRAGNRALMEDRAEEAAASFRETLARYPDSPVAGPAAFKLGFVCRTRLGRSEEALEAYRRVAGLPGGASFADAAAFHAADCLGALGRGAEAIAALEALAAAPGGSRRREARDCLAAIRTSGDAGRPLPPGLARVRAASQSAAASPGDSPPHGRARTPPPRPGTPEYEDRITDELLAVAAASSAPDRALALLDAAAHRVEEIEASAVGPPGGAVPDLVEAYLSALNGIAALVPEASADDGWGDVRRRLVEALGELHDRLESAAESSATGRAEIARAVQASIVDADRPGLGLGRGSGGGVGHGGGASSGGSGDGSSSGGPLGGGPPGGGPPGGGPPGGGPPKGPPPGKGGGNGR